MNKQLKKLLINNSAALDQSAGSFEDIYRITFANGDYIMAEDTAGFRIRRHTYRQVQQRAEQAASGLYERIGATGGYIGLEMENCVDWIAAFWAILRSGNKPYLINTRHPASLSEQILKTLKVRYILAKTIGGLSGEYICFDELKGEGSCPAAFENEIALSTSATSLKESICFYNGQAVTAQILNARTILRQSRRMTLHHNGSLKLLAFLPFYHIFGLFAVYFWFTFYGRTLVFLKDLAPDTILRACRRHQVTHVFAVPILWHTIEKQVWKKAEASGRAETLRRGIRFCTALQNLFPFWGARFAMWMMRSVTDPLFGRSIKFCISGGSYLKDSALELFNGIGYPMHNGFGMSEIGISSVELDPRPCRRNLNSIGKPFDSVEYRISAEGTLQVKGTSLCTRRIIEDQEIPTLEWMDTGDIMECDARGSYYIRGRKGDAVIGENGENINPDGLEQHFDLPEAQNFSVLGLPSAEGEQLSLVVQISPYLAAERAQAMIRRIYAINDSLPSTHQIRAFWLTYQPIAPKTAIKVGRKYLLRAIEQGAVTLLPFSELKNEAAAEFDREKQPARQVLKIIGKHLECAPASIDADAHLIHELGATSLQYFAILSDLAAEFSIPLKGEEQNCSTVREFCDYIGRNI